MYFPGDKLNIPRGLTSVIGSGGKTSFLRYFSRILPGRIILTTSTHMFQFPGVPLIDTTAFRSETDLTRRISSVFSESRILQIGSLSRDTGKLGPPGISPSCLLSTADHVLAEADGSRGYPLKAHRSFEPVIWPDSSLTICLIGASGINRQIAEVCHCPEIFCDLAACFPEDPAVPERIAAVLNAEDLADMYLVNQADLFPDKKPVLTLCESIKKPAAAGSLQEGRFL